MMEYWSIATLQHSTTPPLHDSSTPPPQFFSVELLHADVFVAHHTLRVMSLKGKRA